MNDYGMLRDDNLLYCQQLNYEYRYDKCCRDNVQRSHNMVDGKNAE